MADREETLLCIASQLKELLNSETYNFDRLICKFLEMPSLIFNSSKINWSSAMKDLVQQVKLCVVYNTPEFYHLFNYKTGDKKQPTYFSDQDNSKSLCKRACVFLGLLADKMSAKDNYALLHAIVECNGSPDFRFKDLIRSKEDQKFRISTYIGYNDLFEFLKVLVCKTKSLLAFAESRTTRNVFTVSASCEVSFTSVSVEMANVIKELLEFGLEVLSEYSFKEENVQLSVDTINDLIYEVAISCPLERLDPKVFEGLAQHVSNMHQIRPMQHHRKTFTSLCRVLMQHDPEITAAMQPLLTDKLLFRHRKHERSANSVVIGCYRSVTMWLSAVNLRSQRILALSVTTESELKLLSVLCGTKSFSQTIFRDCSLLLGLVVCVLRSSAKLDDNISGGYHGNVTNDLHTVHNVIVEATNLLCAIVKLCSQKCAEDSCSWNALEDESPRDPGIKEFSELWISIFELLPRFVETQNTNVANGILNAVAEIGESLYNLLRESPLQRKIITTVLVYCSVEIKSDIRAKAGRALARLIEFNCMSESINFSMDAFDAIKLNLKASELNVRVSFSWAFGNWSDLYLQEYLTSGDSDNAAEHNHMISDFHEIIRNSFEAKAKIRYNIFRGAGNLLKFVQRLESDNVGKVKDIILVLIDQVGKGSDFKARWNATCALRNVFTNACLLTSLEPEVKNRTMQCFIKYMCQSENFKERIQCVMGASSVNSRVVYGDHYMLLWDKLATASSVEPLEFQSEVGQAEKLNIEVGRGYIHLASLLVIEDLVQLDEIIMAKWEGIEFVIKFAVANSPLDGSPECELAVRNLESLMKLNLRPFELEVCSRLHSILNK